MTVVLVVDCVVALVVLGLLARRRAGAPRVETEIQPQASPDAR
jgi:hypothetical protein